MTIINQALWILAYAVLAIVTHILSSRLFGLSDVTAALVGAILFILLIQIHAARNRSREREDLDNRMMALREDYQATMGLLEETREDINTLRSGLEDLDNRSGSELVSELRVLQSMLSRLTEKRPGQGQAGRNIFGHGTNEHALAHGASGGVPGGVSEAALDPDRERDAILNIMHNALEDNRIDLYLQPIVNLPSRKVAFYEAFSRVRDETGQIIFPRQYLNLAAETGLVGTLDNLLLFRCIQVIRRLGPRRPNLRFFCNISPASLNDEDFFPQFLDFMTNNLELADRLVFEFAQADVRNQSSEVEHSLSTLGRRGFRFSMDQVMDLDLDVADLARRNFSYVKVGADTFLGGAPGHLHKEDLEEALSRRGIELIIEKIEDEASVVEVLEYGVNLGQGYLFGEPRPSRDDVSAEETVAFDES